MIGANEDLFRRLERELFAAHEGTPDLEQSIASQVWVSRNGGWQLVSSQGTAVPAEV